LKYIRNGLGVFLCLLLFTQTLHVYAFVPQHQVVPYYETENRAKVSLTFDKNVAKCVVTVLGEKGTTKISGTVQLYDETAKKSVKTWSISSSSAVCTLSKDVSVKSGHKYTLSCTAKVYDANNSSKAADGSATKTN